MPEAAPVVYRYGADPAQFGELWLPDGPAAGTVVVIHGGFWRPRYDLSLGRPLAADLAARGYAAWNLEYRRALAGGGWPATFEDAAAGIDLLATLPVDTSRVAAVGHSAGGHLAAWAAGRAELPLGAPGANPAVAVTGVVSQAGVLALADCAREHVGGTAALDLMGGGPDELPEEYRLADPVAAVPITASVVCLHSRADTNVPYSYSERYVAAATAAGGRASLIELSGDHFTLIDPGSADWAAAIGALPALLSLASLRSERRTAALLAVIMHAASHGGLEGGFTRKLFVGWKENTSYRCFLSARCGVSTLCGVSALIVRGSAHAESAVGAECARFREWESAGNAECAEIAP